jgi:hypothetical protein
MAGHVGVDHLAAGVDADVGAAGADGLDRLLGDAP